MVQLRIIYLTQETKLPGTNICLEMNVYFLWNILQKQCEDNSVYSEQYINPTVLCFNCHFLNVEVT